jgi:hypothetical protein
MMSNLGTLNLSSWRMLVLLLIYFSSISSAIAADFSRDLFGLTENVNVDGESLYDVQPILLPDIQNENPEADLAELIALPGAGEESSAEISQTLDGAGGELDAQTSEVLAGKDSGLGFEEPSLGKSPDYIDSEISAAISCEPGSLGTAKKRKRGQNQPPEQCFDNSGGICPKDKPNLLCCEEPVMYTHVFVRGCVICKYLRFAKPLPG